MIQLRYPVNFIGITQGFKFSHKAIDLGWNSKHGGKNQDIYAPYDGVVEAIINNKYNNTKDSSDAGNIVKIKHADGYITQSCHMLKDSIIVKVGDNVKTGQVIGKMGNTGYSFGEHDHFIVWLNGTKVNPIEHLYVYPGQVIASSTSKEYKLLNYIGEVIPEPTPQPTEFKVGDKVIVKAGTVYANDSYGKKFGIRQNNDYETTIAIKTDLSRPYPYNVYGNHKQYLGWVAESNITRK